MTLICEMNHTEWAIESHRLVHMWCLWCSVVRYLVTHRYSVLPWLIRCSRRWEMTTCIWPSPLVWESHLKRSGRRAIRLISPLSWSDPRSVSDPHRSRRYDSRSQSSRSLSRSDVLRARGSAPLPLIFSKQTICSRFCFLQSYVTVGYSFLHAGG